MITIDIEKNSQADRDYTGSGRAWVLISPENEVKSIVYCEPSTIHNGTCVLAAEVTGGNLDLLTPENLKKMWKSLHLGLLLRKAEQCRGYVAEAEVSFSRQIMFDDNPVTFAKLKEDFELEDNK